MCLTMHTHTHSLIPSPTPWWHQEFHLIRKYELSSNLGKQEVKDLYSSRNQILIIFEIFLKHLETNAVLKLDYRLRVVYQM